MATPPGPPDDAGRPSPPASGDSWEHLGRVPVGSSPEDQPAASASEDGWPGLRAAAAVGPFFAVDRFDGDPSWRALTEFAEHPDGLAARVTAALESPLLQPLRRTAPDASGIRVAASIAFLGLAARLVSPALGSALSTGIVPNLSWDRLSWRAAPTGILPLACGPIPGWALIDRRRLTHPDVIAVLSETIITPTLALAETVAGQFGVSEQVVRGNVASAIAGAAATVVRSGRCTEQAAIGLAAALIGQPGLAGSGSFSAAGRESGEPQKEPRFRRNSCCLLYLAGGGFCGDCVLGRADS